MLGFNTSSLYDDALLFCTLSFFNYCPVRVVLDHHHQKHVFSSCFQSVDLQRSSFLLLNRSTKSSNFSR